MRSWFRHYTEFVQRTDKRATYALAILTFINLFNYIDRWVISAVVEPLKLDLGLTDTQIGFIGTGFILVYALTSPVFGSLGDRRARPPLIALGVAIWSIATAMAGFARGFWTLLIARSTVGVGEAAYGTIAPALLSDQFPIEKRGRVFAVFFAAIPVGSAMGYVLGGLADQHFGWRAAFWIAGFPGLLLSLLVLVVKDPPRGQNDTGHTPRVSGNAYRDLLRNRPYVLSVLGYAMYTFALGGLAFWMPAFLERARGMPRADATVTFGAIVIVTGFVGTFLGGWLGDVLLKRTKQSYLWVSGIATLLAAPLTFIGLTSHDKTVYLTAIVIAEVLIFMCTGPINSAIVNVVSPLERATAVGLSVLVMHFLGDIPSPPLIGAISDATSLDRAILVVPAAVLLAGLIWTYAAWKTREA
ncbi:MAG TPA: MFS transporter [Thermoanaerobaculia bacterium]|nr:MFS transporter [Thermoanaerobaculia bacterium]